MKKCIKIFLMINDNNTFRSKKNAWNKTEANRT